MRKLPYVIGLAALVSCAEAAVSIPSAFAGPTSDPFVSVSGGLSLGASKTETIGPGWVTTVNVGVGLVASTSATMTGSGTYTVRSGGVASVANSVFSERVFTGQTVDSNSIYQVSLSRSSAAVLNALQSATLSFGYKTGSTYTLMDNSVTNTGVLGLADLLGIFGSNNTASWRISSGDSVPAGSEFFIRINTSNLATVGGSTASFSMLSVSAVPEPAGALAGVLLVSSMVASRTRRRLVC